MRLLLIRHGETVDNVAGKYAGHTDSALTNHGVLQANRLGTHLAKVDVKVCKIFSSDLQRAFKTADAIRRAQDESTRPEVTKLEILREQDYGFYEGKVFSEKPRDTNKTGLDALRDVHKNTPGFKDVESKAAMKGRMDTFIDTHLLELLQSVSSEQTVVVVAHGIILSHLWRCLLCRFTDYNVSVADGAVAPDKLMSLEHLGAWSNTGYLDLEIKHRAEDAASTIETESTETASSVAAKSDENSVMPAATTSNLPCKLLDMLLMVKAVNSLEHLKGLKKTRGGIGSLKHDSKQKTMDSFFSKKRKLESP